MNRKLNSMSRIYTFSVIYDAGRIYEEEKLLLKRTVDELIVKTRLLMCASRNAQRRL